MLTAILALAFLTGALAALAATAPAAGALSQRLARVGQLAMSPNPAHRPLARVLLDEEEMALPFTQRVLLPIRETLLRRVAAVAPRAVQERARLRLLKAAVSMDPAQFVGLQASSAAAGAVIGLLLGLPAVLQGQWAGPLLLATVFALTGWRVPALWLVALAGRRQTAIQRGLPDVLDVLSVSVEAGLGFDGAMQKVAEKFTEPLAGEFREFLKEVRLGRPRAEALRRLAERSGVADLQTFAAAMIQAEQLGVSIARVLRSQAETMRQKRKRRVEERAMQLPIKMLFPLILFIFPTLFVVILGPVVLQLMGGFKF